MAPKSKALPLWDPYETFDVFPNTRNFQCLDPRCWESVDRKDTRKACARLDEMALEDPLVLKDPSGSGEEFLAGLAVLCFCSRHREDPMHEDEIMGKVSEWFGRIEDVLEERDEDTEEEMDESDEDTEEDVEGHDEETEEESEGCDEELQEEIEECDKDTEEGMDERDEDTEEEIEENDEVTEEDIEEHDEVTEEEMEVRGSKKAKKKAKQEEENEVIRLLDEVNGLNEQLLQQTVDEKGMLEKQFAADEQRSTKKQTTMSKEIIQLQKQVSEAEDAKKDVELAKTAHAREKERLERELDRIEKIAACSREVKIKEANELKIQLQDSSAQVEEAARHIDELKGQLEESNARIGSMKRETSEDIRELKGQLDKEREITMVLDELTSQLKKSNTRLEESNISLEESNTCLDENNSCLTESNTRLEEINANLEESNIRLGTRLDESNTRLEESKSHHEVMERQTTVEINKLRDQLDENNTNLGDMKQGSIKEASELKDQLTRCKDIIAELKAAESANIAQCEADKSNNFREDCQTENACDIAGSQQSIDSDDAVEESMAASSHEKNQSTEEVHGLKEKLCDGKAASTMPTSVLHTEFQNLRMWTQFSICGLYVELLFKQRKVEQAGTANPALLDEVLRLREQARDVDRRLASQIVGLSLVSLRIFQGC